MTLRLPALLLVGGWLCRSETQQCLYPLAGVKCLVQVLHQIRRRDYRPLTMPGDPIQHQLEGSYFPILCMHAEAE